MNTRELLYYNGFGGFSKDGKEYIICTNETSTPAPWSHVIANEHFGTVITANGGGYVWSGNSRDNKLTTWSNDPVTDKPSEILWMECEDKKNYLLPYDSLENYIVRYGFGYACFERTIENLSSKVTIFVPKDENKKIYNIKISNQSNDEKEIHFFYKIEPVLGVSRDYTKKHLVISQKENGIEVNNFYRENYSNEKLIIGASEKIEDVKIIDKIICMNFKILVKANEEKNVTIEIGTAENLSGYEITKNVSKKLEEVVSYWNCLTSKIQIRTPIESMNIIMNGWLLYQTLSSRIFARTSFYQASGAFGFRDQLQDSLMLLYFDPKLTRKQILYHAAHQFEEGDVLHWWHPEKDNGIRTRYTDDLLWLPYVLYEYIEKEKDYAILDEEVPYVKMNPLLDFENERYENVEITTNKDTIFEHAKRAIEKSLEFGENGLPVMGSGDWNDGMNNIKGQSVWLRILFI